MIVFKTFLKILNKDKFIILMYTILLIGITGFSMKTSDSPTNFEVSKPDILIINEDKNEKISENLVSYMNENCNIKNIENSDDKINDALFYRDVNYIIYIPENYSKDFLNGKNPSLTIKSTEEYDSKYAEMLLSRYVKVANIYRESITNEDDLINNINNTLTTKSDVEITSKLDTNKLSKATFYYNFLNYSILAGCVYVICLILSSFKEENVNKRMIVSSMNYKKINRDLLASNAIFAIVLWTFYVILSFILIGNIMFTLHGLIYIINSFVFTICSLTLAFLIGNLVNNKNAINGIINVVALGSSFLCGAFVPAEFLPSYVIKIAHALPSYYYINSNEIIKSLENINIQTLKPIITNVIIILVFTISFIAITNIISKKKRKIG